MLARVQFRGDYLFSVSQSVGVRMRPHRAYSQFLRILSATKNTIVNRLLLLIDAFPIHSSVFFPSPNRYFYTEYDRKKNVSKGRKVDGENRSPW